MEDSDTLNASQLVQECYRDYGEYVNTTRAVTGIDGLKKVQRRMFLAIQDSAKNNWTQAASVLGSCMKYHPHSEQHSVLVSMYHNGLVEGQGNFGSSLLEHHPPAAPRYPSIKANKKLHDILFGLKKYVPHETEHEFEEPIYLATPIPFALLTGTIGIGVGLLNSVPSFDLRSLIKARKKDDPSLLRPPKGVSIMASDIERIWERGEGWIQYGLSCYNEWSHVDNKNVIVVEGSTRIFVPNLIKGLNSWLQDEYINLRDESTDKLRVIIARTPYIKKVTDSMIHDTCQRLAKRSFYYRIYCNQDGHSAVRLSMRNWLDQTWKLFNDVVESWREDNVNYYDGQIEIYSYIPKVSPHVLDNMSARQIAKELKISESLVKSIEDKPIKLLRQGDFQQKIDDLNSKKKEVQNTTVESLEEKFVEAIEEQKEEV